MQHHDLLILGAVSKDFNITPENEERSIGGAAVYSSVLGRRYRARVETHTHATRNDVGH